MGKVFNFLSKETKGLHQAAYLLAFFTLLSQILGLLRDRLLAASFGAGHTLDVYYAAFRVPDFIFTTVSSLVSVSVLVPFLVRLQNRGGEEERSLLDSVFTVFGLAIVVAVAAAYVFMPELTRTTVPGLASPDLIPMARILLLSPLLLGLSNIAGSVTQAAGRFMAYALSPILYNAGIIVGVVFLVPHFGIFGLVYGVVGGSLLHLLIQLPSIVSQGLLPRFTLNVSWKLMAEVFTLSIPRTLTLATGHLVMLGLIASASFMAAGSISIFNFAWNLQSVPMGLIGVSYSLAAFPLLTRLFAEGKREKFVEEVVQPLLHILFWSIPVTVLFIVLRAQIVRVILGSGHFDWNDTRLTAAACALFVLSMVAQNVALLLIRAHYASGHTKKPFVQAIISAAVTFIIVYGGFMFVGKTTIWFFVEALFRVSGITGTEVLLLPLAFSVGAILQAVLLWRSFAAEYPGFSTGILKSVFQSFGASILGGYATYLLLSTLGSYLNPDTLLGVLLQGLGAGMVGIGVTAGVLKALGNQEINVVIRTVHSRIWKTRPVLDDAETLA